MLGNMKANVTMILDQLAAGDASAVNRLFPLVYDEFRALARSYLAGERSGHTLQPTALVHEAYMKLVDQRNVRWQNRNHFFAVGAIAMRRLLVDHARAHVREKRGGGQVPLELTEDVGLPVDSAESLIALDEALDRLAALDPRQAKVVELRFFAGLTVPEAAGALGLAPRTVEQEWTMAKAWLRRELS